MNVSKANKAPLRILLLEDFEADAELAKREIRKAGINFTDRIVCTRVDFLRELEIFNPDVILSDFSMPQFDALDALRILAELGKSLPFILYTGSQSEEVAVECMKRGADDYVLKSSLTRLPTALQNALKRREAMLREHEAIEALRRSEQSFRALIESSPDGIAVEKNGLIVYANVSLEKYLGYEGIEGLAGRAIGDLFPPAVREAALAAMLDLNGRVVEEHLLRRDATHLIGEIACIGIDFDGQSARALIIRDVTERKQMQARLLLADRLASLGTLAAGVAHEVNNPLGYVITNLQYVDEEYGSLRDGLNDLRERFRDRFDGALLDPLTETIADLAEPVRIARRGADRVRQIVRDLTAFARSDGDGREAVDVRVVLEFTLKMAGGEVSRRARLKKDFQDVALVNANESRLGQVFLNLLINASQAIPEGHPETHEICIRTRQRDDGYVLIEFQDTGVGIPQDVQSRIFDPFFTTKPVGIGTGLGLSICHTLVTGLGGTITVKSVAGKGTTFTVAFPPNEAGR